VGYESRLIVGEVFGNMNTSMPDDPCPMWMNPIIEVSLSKMGNGEFAKVRQKAKYSGVFIFRVARMRVDQGDALEIAVQMISDLAPEGAFEKKPAWWSTLQNMEHERQTEHKEWEDPYGEPFRRLPLRETAEALRTEWERDKYRRALLGAETLEHFVRGVESGTWQEYDPTTDGTSPDGRKIMLIHEGY